MDHLFRLDGALLSTSETFKVSKFLKLRWSFLILFVGLIILSKPASVLAKESGIFAKNKKNQNNWFKNVSPLDIEKMKMMKLKFQKIEKKISEDQLKKGKSGSEDKVLKLNHEWIKSEPNLIRE